MALSARIFAADSPNRAAAPGAQQDGRRIERVESRGEPSPDRVGARDRKLLRHDDGRKPGEPVRPPAQRRSPGRGHKSDKPGIDFSERAKSGVEIGLSVNV